MQLDAKTTALVLIDLQRGIVTMPVVPHSGTMILERSRHLAARCRAAGALVVWVRVAFGREFVDALRPRVDQPSNHSAFQSGWDEFAEPPQEGDVVVTKRQWGAFYGTDLDLQLRRRARSTLVVGGIATSIGVESTVRSAWEHGYEQVICEDLCGDRKVETHTASFAHIFPRLSRVTNSEAITFE